jgi:hypothetical protein
VAGWPPLLSSIRKGPSVSAGFDGVKLSAIYSAHGPTGGRSPFHSFSSCALTIAYRAVHLPQLVQRAVDGKVGEIPENAAPSDRRSDSTMDFQPVE